MNKIPKYKFYFAFADLVVLTISFISAAYLVRYDKTLNIWGFIDLSYPILLLFLVATLFFILIFQINGLYKINIILNRSAHLTAVIKSLYYGTLNIVVISHLVKSSDILDSRLIIFIFLLIAIPMLYLLRVELFRNLLLRYKQQYKSNVVIVGDGNAGKLLATKLLFENPEGINILGFVNDREKNQEEIVHGVKILGVIDELGKIKDQYKIDEILIAIDNIKYDRLLEILDICKKLKVAVKLSSELFDIVTQKISAEKYAGIPFLSVSPYYNSNLMLGVKRFFDTIISIFVLIVLSPFLALIAILIKLSSPGPILFKQIRIGKNGRPFNFYKFRSMRVVKDDDEERKQKMIQFMKDGVPAGSSAKIINENRVTWIGKIIRKTSLDEIPQLFNVIIGDMSLVGPRPSLQYEYENYDSWQKRRVKVLPGCTGVWQVWGRSTVSFIDSVVLDLYYINNMSPWLDLQVLFKTVPVMLFSKGGK